MENFSEWLSRTLVERGMSQADLAAAAKLDTAVISNLVNGKRGPGVETCKAIAAGLGIPTKLVFVAAGFLEPEKELTPTEIMALHYLSQLHPDDQERIILYLELLANRYKFEGKRP
jgi:transcriptional regulator with XRE-family HTH domain